MKFKINLLMEKSKLNINDQVRDMKAMTNITNKVNTNLVSDIETKIYNQLCKNITQPIEIETRTHISSKLLNSITYNVWIGMLYQND